MREPDMKWFFEPRAEADQSEQDDDSAPGLIDLPAALLQRHGARVLDPAKAALANGDDPPRPTVYRARTLLVPEGVLRDVETTQIITTVLAGIGLALVSPGRAVMFSRLPQLPRSVVLVPLADHPTPVVVDAWVALQALRAAGTGHKQPDRYHEAVQQITLEHLLVGSPITGSPIDGGPGGISGGPGSSGGTSGPTITDSYLFSGGEARSPVAVLCDPPARKTGAECASDYGRRPVVAVLDTGVRAQPWLDVAADGAGGYTMAADGFVATDDNIQAAICAEGLAINARDKSRRVIKDCWDKPVTANPLTREFNPATGHGTFIAGIVRQVAPDAQVLAIRILHSDDVAYEGDIICALGLLYERIALAAPGDLAGSVDVVSLSFGYFSESPHSMAFTSGLWTVIKELLDLGVVVMAAAGNYATSREFYPAAFAQSPAPADPMSVISVGALNPDGSKTIFSNDGRWVSAWALGAMVVSTYPVDVNGGRTPELRVAAAQAPPGVSPPERAALDPDDYSGGWAIWSGTSFSAPYLAALVTAALLKGAASGLRLDLPDKKERALAALAELRNKGEERRNRE
jgi:hypothetical protein